MSESHKAGRTSLLQTLKEKAHQLKQETYALTLAYRDPRTPWYAKTWAAFVVAYAVSPIDLIPDFIPVLGYMDDLVLIPAGVALAIRMIPSEVMQVSREKSSQYFRQGKSTSVWGAVIVIFLWLDGLVFAGWLVVGLVK